MSSDVAIQRAIQPVYPLDIDVSPILLHAGPLSAMLRGKCFEQRFDGEGAILFRLAPEPCVPWKVVAAPSNLPTAVENEIVEDLIVPDFSELSFPDQLVSNVIPEIPRAGVDYVEFGGGLSRTCIGDPDLLSELRFNLVGFPLRVGAKRILYPDGSWRPGRVELGARDWMIEIDAWIDLEKMPYCAPGAVPYKYMRVCRIRKADCSLFSAKQKELENLRIALSSFLSFISGGLVGLALPVGLDKSGVPKYVEWSSTHFDSICRFRSWYSERYPEFLAPLFSQFIQRLEEPLWGSSLLEVIRQYVAAVGLEKDFAVGLLTACAALESLSWAILVQETESISGEEYGALKAAERLEGLLEWAGIPEQVPRSLGELVSLAERKKMNGPWIIFWLRNRIAHADKKSELDADEVCQAWRVSVWYLELLLLRLLGFNSRYRCRITSTRDAIAQDEVPWLNG